MRDGGYFSKLREFLSNERRGRTKSLSKRRRVKRASPFRMEQLEARVLLAGDLASVTLQAAVVQEQYTEGAINIGQAFKDSGYRYVVGQNFGTTGDSNTAPTVSKLRVYENGQELGPAHSLHTDIAQKGQGRFSHWGNALYFSASDNTNPLTNGRSYTYRVYTDGSTSTTTAPSYVEGMVDIGEAFKDSGYRYVVGQNFGTTGDSNTAPTVSKLRVYENGQELGPAHSLHTDIAQKGQGRFSHWGNALYFSASDNTNPLTNGRSYTYRVYTDGSTSTTTAPTTTTTATSPTTTTTTTSPTTIPMTGQVFYVSPNGSDSGAGTQASPWRTIKTAAQKLLAGQTAILADGVYEEGSIQFANSGTADKPITIKAENKWGAILSSTSGRNAAIDIYKSYITIENIRISVSPKNVYDGPYISTNAAIRAWGTNTPTVSNPSTGSQGFTARGLLIDASTARDTGIKTNQDFSTIENSVVYNEIEAFNNRGTIIRNNTVYDGGPNKTYILGKGGVRDLQIYNNIVHMTQSGVGILLGGSSGLSYMYEPSKGIEAYNSVAYNNVVINKSGDQYSAAFQMRGASNSLFANNIGINAAIAMGNGGSGTLLSKNVNPRFIDNILVGNGTQPATNGRYGWAGYWTGTLTVDRNNFYGFGSGLPSQTNAIVGDPKFANRLSDWHLQAGSPALSSGVQVSFTGFNGQSIDLSRNKDGITRTVPWNLGIY